MTKLPGTTNCEFFKQSAIQHQAEANHTTNIVLALNNASKAVAYAKGAHHLCPQDHGLFELVQQCEALHHNIMQTIHKIQPEMGPY